jgi:hypothetical protein
MSTLHRGQSSWSGSAISSRSTFAPQWEQNFAPLKISPKHDGHATVASRAPQCSHTVASDLAGAPHIGQLRVTASICNYLVPICPIPQARKAQRPLQKRFYFPLHSLKFTGDDLPAKKGRFMGLID